MNQWLDRRLGDVATLQRGFDLPDRLRQPGRVPVVTSSGENGFHSESKVRAPGVVTGRYGTIGQVFFVERDFWPLNTTLWVKDFHGNEPRFVYYLLQSIDFDSCNDKSGVPGLNRNDLHEIEVLVPPIGDQRAIAAILGALDDKIDLNRQMNHTLEEMASALFKSWFIDFDPVAAKAAGRQPFGMDAATAALFPAGFEETAEGPIPQGWRLGRAEDVLNLAYGKPLKTEHRVPGPYPVYGSGGSESTHSKPLVAGPGIIVGRKGTAGAIHWEFRDFYPIDTTFFVESKPGPESMRWLFHRLCREDLPSMGADSAVPGLNRNVVHGLAWCIPHWQVVHRFDAAVAPWTKLIASGMDENRTLAALRDLLLPQLLSGEIRIKDAENLVAAHL